MSITTLSWTGAAAASLLAVMTLQTEISIRLDNLIVTEAEAADWAEQNRIDRLENKIEVLTLKLKHALDLAEVDSLKAQLARARRELEYILCITDPRNGPEHCIP